MGPHLRISVGTSRSKLQVVAPNHDENPLKISSDAFEGSIAVRIRDFQGEVGQGKDRRASTESDYFDTYKNLTWSMAIQGRFKEDVNADDVVFGNIFDKPIRDHLPYGTAAALKFVHFVDPSLEQDIYADKPWALSPLIATMNHMHVTRLKSPSASLPSWSPAQPDDDILPLYTDIDEVKHLKGDANARRTWFSEKDKRKEVTFTPKDALNLDFCNGYLDFNTFSLKIPGGLSFSLLKYWDGQPVTYVCRNRTSHKEYFYIVFEIIDDEVIAKKDVGHLAQERKDEEEQRKEQKQKEASESTGKNANDMGID